MESRNSLIPKISAFLENRQKANNFGTCKRCLKSVYWSTTKIASHIRSGHCSGASEEEVQQFKQEFVYETPKNLIHKSLTSSSFKNSFVIQDFKKENAPINTKRHMFKQEESSEDNTKRAKTDESNEEHLIEEQNDTNELLYEMPADSIDGNNVEILYLADSDYDRIEKKAEIRESLDTTMTTIAENKEEKFITVVYPQFKGRSKLQLIDEILDLKRRNELLQSKVKTYENTINKLL